MSMKTIARMFLVLLLSLPLMAHHGSAAYNNAERVVLKGIIKECSFSNPHIVFKLETTDATWEISLAAPGPLRAAGLTQESFKSGTEATVWGAAHRTKPHDMYASGITIGDITFGNK